MKYSIEQKEIIKQLNLDKISSNCHNKLTNQEILKEIKFKKEYPIKVDIKENFYIIQSKMNDYDFTQL